VAGWLGLRLRQLLFALPALSIAASQARLSPLPGSTARMAVAAAVVAAWASQHPAVVAAVAPSLQPWLRLSVVEALAAMALAAGLASLVGRLQPTGLRLVAALLPAKVASWSGAAPTCLGTAAIAASSVVHPGLSICCGVLCLTGRLAAAAKAACPPSRRAMAWPVYYKPPAPLPVVGLCSGKAGRRQQALPWTDGRLLVLLLALHALLLRGSKEEGGRALGRALAAAALHEAAATAGGAACLLGHPFVLVYTSCASAAAQLM